MHCQWTLICQGLCVCTNSDSRFCIHHCWRFIHVSLWKAFRAAERRRWWKFIRRWVRTSKLACLTSAKVLVVVKREALPLKVGAQGWWFSPKGEEDRPGWPRERGGESLGAGSATDGMVEVTCTRFAGGRSGGDSSEVDSVRLRAEKLIKYYLKQHNETYLESARRPS